jgi:hypothetical protein
MNTNGKIVPCNCWVAPNGVRYSPYSSYVPEGSELVTKGWTIRWVDGTEGTGRKAFETKAEAEAYLAKVPKSFKGMHAIGN